MFFSGGEFCRQRSVGNHRCRNLDQSKTPARTAFCIFAHALCHSSVHRRLCLARAGWNAVPKITHNMGAAFMLYAQGLLPFLLPLSVSLFEPDAKSRRRMLPFLVIGILTTLYILWALAAYPTEISVKGNSIVYINQATNNTFVAILYVIATCGSLLFSKVKDMVLFGIANLAILLAVMAVKRYAFTSLWCAYAAIASVIILAYFWKSGGHRPFQYAGLW